MDAEHAPEAAPRGQAERDRVVLTTAGIVDGAKRMGPMGVSALAFGIAFGVLARQTGLSAAEALLMSALVMAGASQFVALGLWAAPLPVLPILVATLAVNSRHLLLGATMLPWFSRLPAWKTYVLLYFLNDANWALSLREFTSGRRDVGFFLGGGLLLTVVWILGTGLGFALGGAMGSPARWGLDFVITAFFIALLMRMWRGRVDAVPWAVAAAVSLVAAQLLPSHWHIIAGGIAGGLTGALRDGA
ncbi:MAG: AzlC family ABC transporter permease [Pseudomonadota bacterium]|nr:AzlC family ABC transporter permease [Pseudomonadota bacterium]